MTVEVEGEASGGNRSSVEEVEALARQDAIRKAMEQAAGVYVASETTVSMGAIEKDEIASWGQGLVKVIEVLDIQTDYDAGFKALRCRIRIRAEVSARDTRELLSRIGSEHASQTGELTETSFSYTFRGRRKQADGSWAPLNVGVSSELLSGDQVQILLRVDKDCHAYVINRDATGQIYVLFPHEESVSNSLKGGAEYVLPDHGKYYELDDHIGEETFFLAVSATPMSDLAWMIDRTRRAGDRSAATAMLDGTLRTRGLRSAARIVNTQDSDTLAGGQMVGSGPIVRVISFNHR